MCNFKRSSKYHCNVNDIIARPSYIDCVILSPSFKVYSIKKKTITFFSRLDHVSFLRAFKTPDFYTYIQPFMMYNLAMVRKVKASKTYWSWLKINVMYIKTL